MGHVAYALHWSDGTEVGLADGSDSVYTHGALSFNDTLVYYHHA
jgi:hypothetical protein